MERALGELGAAVRNADDVYAGGSASAFRGFPLKARQQGRLPVARLALPHLGAALRPQVVAVLFSRFEEVLYLDSDNVALRDPTGAAGCAPAAT